MKLMRDIGLLYKRSFIETLRNPMWVAVGISTPLLYLVLFTPLLQKLAGGPGFPTSNVLDVFLPGILAFLAFGNGTGRGFTVIFELQQGLTERLQVTPVNRFALLTGPILASVSWLIIFVVILVAVAVPFGYDVHIAGVLISFILLALLVTVFAGFSVCIALITREINSFAAIISGINLPLLLLSGVLLPLTLAPTWMRVIAYFNPIYYVVEADRLLAAGNIGNTTVGLGFLVMVLLTVAVLWWATWVHRRAVE
jgi:ABC-2 type transport system permease protein